MIERFHDALIEPHELAARFGGPQLAVLDCRYDLAKPQWGEAAYARSHIVGAVYAHLDRDLSGPITRRTGRHPLPSLDAFAAKAGEWGIDEHVQVVAYDQGNGAYAARAWWLLRSAGHARVAVLNGGFAAWQDAALRVASEIARRPPRTFVPGPARARWLSTDQVQSELARRQIRLVDARAADRFAGRNETIDPVAGHIPGAVNHPFTSNLDAQGRFLPRDALRRRWRATAGDFAPEQVVAMCGSGVTACHNLLALELAGMAGASLYAGSWSEWIRDPARPVALEEGPDG